MATNPYFRPYNYGSEQRLQEEMVVESIKIHGLDFKYLPRTIVDQDFLLGEDRLGTYDLAVDIELYVKDTLGFQGTGDLLNKLGSLFIDDQIILTMARRRWAQISTEKLGTEEGYLYQVETANTYAYGNSDGFLLESGSANGYSITSSRPMEGDILFCPLNNKLYEIKFVEHENPFYQGGKLYTYDLTVALFDRDSRLQTGNTVIDTISVQYSQDILLNQYLAENGDNLVTEDGYDYITEYRLEDTVPTANNEAIFKARETYVDFSEQSPFLEIY